jgi:hypothetical protein
VTYCSLAELKALLDIPVSFTEKDSVLELAVSAASGRIDGWCDRSFTVAGTAAGSATPRVFAPQASRVVYVDDIANLEGLVVATDNDGDGVFEETWPTTDFQFEPVNALAKGRPVNRLVAVNRNLPVQSRPAPVRVTANWGWPSVPDEVRQACLLLAGRMFKRGDSLLGVAGFGDAGAVTVRRVDPDVEALLSPFRRVAVG